jgi:uncharacterized protein YqiB (DUF1249 family)
MFERVVIKSNKALYFVDQIDFEDPDLLAKVYFDARMVEVKGWINADHHELLRELGRRFCRPLDQCWTRNIMLNKWLDYLLDQGHLFPVDTS